MSSLRLALCQLDSVVGDISGNIQRVLDQLSEAESLGADLAVFPELVLTGYPPEDLLLIPAFVEANQRALAKVAAATTSCVAIVGFVDGSGELYNAAAVCADGKVLGTCHKELLPNYAVFDERRWFVPSRSPSELFEIAGAKVGVTICEDAWSGSGPVLRLGTSGADLVVSINASPYRKAIFDERRAMLSTRAVDASCAIAYVNMVGGQDELVFDGTSMVVDSSGTLIASAAQFKPEVTVFDLDLSPTLSHRESGRSLEASSDAPAVKFVSAKLPFDHDRPILEPRVTAPLGAAEECYEALVLGTRDYIGKNNFGDVVIGLSGGVDSALVAVIACDAIGPSRVHGVSMPSRFSADESEQDARTLAENLGMDMSVIAIESVHSAFLDLMEPHFHGRDLDATEENIQARIRGMILMSLSNKLGWLVLTTGNKSEMAVGYATLYGDMAGGFAVVKDVPKTLVYKLCEMRNCRAGYDLVPSNILTKPPTAELRFDQRDDDTLPPYEVLDSIVEGYVEHDKSALDLVEQGFDADMVRQVITMVDRSEYKRRQAPPGIRVTSRAFGKDRRMPITNHYSPGEL